MTDNGAVPVEQLAIRAFKEDDASRFRELLNQHSELRSRVNETSGPFGSPLITQVRSSAMLDVLLDAGADINARSKWWAGGFGLLDLAEPKLAAYALQRGARLTAHAAARLGMLDELKSLIAADPSLVYAKGGDGQTPLHFASSPEIAEYLLEEGADIDARDLDHQSTPAQYMVDDRPEVARYLIRNGCKTDILMAAAVGDRELALRILESDPEAIRMRVSDDYFPIVGSHHGGGTIYQWKLGWHVSACQVAKRFGHDELFQILMDRCPAEEKLLNACWLHDEAMVRELLTQRPTLADDLPAPGRRQLAHAARNDDTVAARLMLQANLPVDARSQHQATPLHWASWHGNAELVRLLLSRKPSLDDNKNDFRGTPLGWALHGSENGWHRERGDYPATVEALLDASAPVPSEITGTEGVKAVFRQRGLL